MRQFGKLAANNQLRNDGYFIDIKGVKEPFKNDK
jgi:hypothetical protein